MSGGSSARSLPDSSLRQDTDLHLIEYQRISHCTETLFFFPSEKKRKKKQKRTLQSLQRSQAVKDAERQLGQVIKSEVSGKQE